MFLFLLLEFGFMLYKVHLLATCKHLTARGSGVQPGDAHCSSVEDTHKGKLIHLTGMGSLVSSIPL